MKQKTSNLLFSNYLPTSFLRDKRECKMQEMYLFLSGAVFRKIHSKLRIDY